MQGEKESHEQYSPHVPSHSHPPSFPSSSRHLLPLHHGITLFPLISISKGARNSKMDSKTDRGRREDQGEVLDRWIPQLILTILQEETLGEV